MGYKNVEIVINPYKTEDVSRKEKKIHRKGLLIRGRWDSSYYDYILENDIKAVYLNVSKGWIEEDYAFLSCLNTIEELSIISTSAKNLDAIEKMQNLIDLEITCQTKEIVDFRKLKNLKICFLNYWRGYESIFMCKNLEDLYIDELKIKDLSLLENLTNVRKLTIGNSNMTSIEWINNLIILEELSFLNCRKIEDFDNIKLLTNLVRLTIDGSKKLNNLDFIQFLKNLVILNISNNGEIESLSPINNLQKLKVLACFGNTNILDGDLSYLNNLPQLALLGCLNRKHYTHTIIQNWNWKNIDKPNVLIKIRA